MSRLLSCSSKVAALAFIGSTNGPPTFWDAESSILMPVLRIISAMASAFVSAPDVSEAIRSNCSFSTLLREATILDRLRSDSFSLFEV